MLIEVNVTRTLPEDVIVMDPNGRQFTQKVVFDWKPEFCQQCQVVGHQSPPPQQKGNNQQHKRRAPRQVTMEWQTKGVVAPVERSKPGTNGKIGEGTNRQIDRESVQPAGVVSPKGSLDVQRLKGNREEVGTSVSNTGKIPQKSELNLADFPVLSSPENSGNTNQRLWNHGHPKTPDKGETLNNHDELVSVECKGYQ